MSDIERYNAQPESLMPDMPAREVSFYVGSDGEATGEIEHLKQVHLTVEQISAANPNLDINLRKVSGGNYGFTGVQILLLDFGIPPRIATISGDFRRDDETKREGYESTELDTPNTLVVEVPDSRGYTYNDEHRLYDHGHTFRRGESVAIAHDGDPVETRTGFIGDLDQCMVHTAYYGKESSYEGKGHIMSVFYDDHILKLRGHEQTRAIVIYGHSVGYTDRHEMDDIGETAQDRLKEFEGRDEQEVIVELLAELGKVATKHTQTVSELEIIEALLVRNKGLLREERSKVWKLERELRTKVKDQPSSSKDDEWLRNLFGQTSRAQADMSMHCEVLGLNPGILSGTPERIVRAAKAMRKVLAQELHPDVNSASDAEQQLKAINNAADSLIQQFNI